MFCTEQCSWTTPTTKALLMSETASRLRNLLLHSSTSLSADYILATESTVGQMFCGWGQTTGNHGNEIEKDFPMKPGVSRGTHAVLGQRARVLGGPHPNTLTLTHTHKAKLSCFEFTEFKVLHNQTPPDDRNRALFSQKNPTKLSRLLV